MDQSKAPLSDGRVIADAQKGFSSSYLDSARRSRAHCLTHNGALAFLILLVCALELTASAQSPIVSIRIPTGSTPRIRVEGRRAATRLWSFRKSYAGVADLGARIQQLRLSDEAGRNIPVRQLAPGEFEATTPASGFSYEVDLTPPERAADAAFVSWLTPDRALLVLGDLLPALFKDVELLPSGGSASTQLDRTARETFKLRFILPADWRVGSADSKGSPDEFEVSDMGSAVFVAGPDLRIRKGRAAAGQNGSIQLNLMVTGAWAFTDDEVLDLAGKILKAHARVFGGSANRPAALIVMPFPVGTSAEKWSAETRGSTATLLIGKQPSRTAALAQLSVPLTHELFHFWVPNAVALDGDYAWFYEGFTVYQAARTAVRVQLLTFEDFLNGIARAYDAYLTLGDRERDSLVEASQRRWGNETVVYQKAMLVAFIYDLTLRLQSGGKHSLDDVYRELFRRHRASNEAGENESRNVNGNEAAIAGLSAMAGMRDFAATFVQRKVAIELGAELGRFGLRVERAGSRSRVTVNEQLNNQQRDLLRQLGYNNRARSSGQTRSRKP